MSRLIEDWRGRKSREDELLHETLCEAIAAGRVQVFTDQRMLDFQGSPVHRQWDHLLPLTVLMTLALAILLIFGLAVGIVGMTLFVMLYLFGNRYIVGWRLRTRATEYLSRDVSHFMALWRMGGLALVAPGLGEPPCLSPKGDWRKFIRRHFGEPNPAPRMVNAPVPLAPSSSSAPPVSPPPDDAEAIVPPPRPVPGARWDPVGDPAADDTPPRDEVGP